MVTTFESGFKTTLAQKLDAADTSMVVATAPTVTAWRLFLKSWSNKERISYTWVTWTTLTWLTRWLSQTADPSSSWTWLTWIAWTEVILVAMHDQLLDRQYPDPLVFANTTARDAALWADWAAAKAFVNVYTTAEWLHRNYNLGTAQWESIDTWTTTPNASTTAAWKVEIATSAESIAWTDTWWTWAKTVVSPSDIAKNEQSATFVYAEDWEASDTYVIALTPALTAYSTWQRIRFKATTVNTWACTINVNALWAKSIKTIAWDDPSDWDIAAWEIVELVYDWTNFVLQKAPIAWNDRKWIVEMCTDAEATTATDETRYINAKQASDNYWFNYWWWSWSNTSITATSTWNIDIAVWYSNPRLIQYFIMLHIQDTTWAASYSRMIWMYDAEIWWSANWLKNSQANQAALNTYLNDWVLNFSPTVWTVTADQIADITSNPHTVSVDVWWNVSTLTITSIAMSWNNVRFAWDYSEAAWRTTTWSIFIYKLLALR